MKKICLLTLISLLAPATAAWAEHPRQDQMARVSSLAHELENAAHHVHRSAERTAHHGSRSEKAALRSLHRLDDRARHFHRQVERYYQDPYHTEADFRELVDAYHQATYRIRNLHAFDHVWEDFHRVQSLMDHLVDYYGGYGTHRHGSRHHRGYDRRYVPWSRY